MRPPSSAPSRAGRRSPADERLMRRASRTMAVQYALALTAIIITVAAVALVLDERQEQMQATAAARAAWSGTIETDTPPTNVWFVIRQPSGRRAATPGTPASVRRLDPDALRDGATRVTEGGRELLAWTGTRGDRRISAVYNLGPREAEERPLLISLGIAAVVGIAVATVAGGLLGRRAVRPLGTAIALHRRFVADASHELRTPLAVLRLRAEMLQSHLPRASDPAFDAELHRLVQDAATLSEVVNDLLLSLDLAHRARDRERVDLWELAGEAAEHLRPMAGRHEITLTATRTDAPGDDAPAVRGARAALRRAVVSLVDNAIAHTPNGGHVRIEIGRREDRPTICVRDDGEGLDLSDTARLTERFGRGAQDDQEVATGGGRRVGLGLALVSEVANAHGGALEMDGSPGGGAAITLVLPPP